MTPAFHPDEVLLDLKAVAVRLNVSVWTVRRLIWSKKLEAETVGRSLRVRPAAIVAYRRRAPRREES